LSRDHAITDGAILTPLVNGYPKTATGTGGTLVIPHWETLDYPGWAEAAALAGQELLDPRAEPHSVATRIASARLVLTESLHGAVLADTFGIPWLAFATSKNFGVTKWVDWTLSLGRDLTLTMLPPPDAGPLLAFGRPPAPFGQTAHFDAEAAMAQFDVRLTPVPETFRAQLKGAVRQSPLMRRFLGFNPARTADALERLARTEPTVTAASVRQELQDRMYSLLLSFADSNKVAAP
jgi:succinoglycan biosynthesis protein ExoV